MKGQGQGEDVDFSAGFKPKLVISALEHVSLDKGSGMMVEGTWSPEGGVFVDAKNITLKGESSFYFFMQTVSSEVKESGVPTGAKIRLVAEDDITMQNIQTFWIVPPFPLDGKAERWGLLFDANNIKLDNSRMDAFNYYNLEANAGEKFLDGDMVVTHPIGYMQFELKANNEITLMNQSAVYISSGRLGLNGRNIRLIDSEVSQNVFRAHESIKNNGLIELVALEKINMVNTQLNSNTWSENSRMDIVMNSKVMNLENTVVSNRDYIQGRTGELRLNVAGALKLKNSSI